MIVQHPDKLIGWASVDPNEPECVEQLEHTVGDARDPGPQAGTRLPAVAHLAGDGRCLANLGYESDITGHIRYRVDIINERLDYAEGTVRPPDRPGVGVSVNEDVLARWRLDT